MELAEVAAFVASHPLLGQLSDARITQLVERSIHLSLGPGDPLTREGDEADAAFVVLGGLLEITIAGQRVRRVGRGAVVGELAVFAGSVRSASVHATRPSRVLRIPAAELTALLRDPSVSAGIVRHLSAQLAVSRAMEPSSMPPRRRIALLSASGDEAMSAAIAARVGDLVTAEVVTPERVPDVGALDAHLNAADRAERTLLLCSVSDPAWVRACLLAADRVLVMVDRSHAAWNEVGEGAEAVVVGGGDGPPGASVVHRLRSVTDEAGIARLARRLAGRSVGAVLSAGGARTLAHIGALDELGRAGIRIDRLGACSMGYLTAGFFAAGHAIDAIPDLIAKVDLAGTWVTHGVRALAKRKDYYEELCGPLLLDLFAISVDLATGREMVHRNGPVGSMLEATMALPGLMDPAVVGGAAHVDGALVNPLPTDVMSEDADGPIVAIDVFGRQSRATKWADKWVSDEREPPSPTDVAIQAMDLASIDRHRQARQLADLLIEPEVPYGTLAFDKMDEIVDAGRRAAGEALDQASEDQRRALGL